MFAPLQPLAFFAGIILVALGLIPYKRLCRLENRPISLRCLNEHLELIQKGRTRNLPVVRIRDFSQKATYLQISLEKEVIQIAHFPPGTAERLRELYF